MFQTLSLIIDIFTKVLLPVLSMAGIGVVAHRWCRYDMQTLVRLNLYLFVPVFLFTRIADSTLQWSEIGRVGLAVMLPILILGGLLLAGMKKSGARSETIAAVLLGGLLFNAANFGIPVAQLAFDKSGGQVQALVVMYLNTTLFVMGYMLMAAVQGKGLISGAMSYFKLPMFYMIVAGFAVRETGVGMPLWLDKATHTLAEAMSPIALVTLGAQLATRARWPRWRVVGPIVIVKLLAFPAMMGLVVWALGLWPWPGAQLVLAAAAPTAINTLLLTIELNGDADTAADGVFWTTLLSAFSVTLVLGVVQSLGGKPPG